MTEITAAWLDAAFDLARGRSMKLTAAFVLLGMHVASPDAQTWSVMPVPLIVFLGGLFYAGRGIRRLGREADARRVA